MSRREPFHAVTWLVWVLSTATCVQLAPSPGYVLLIIGISAVVVEAHNAGGLLRRAFPALLLVGAVFGAVKVVLTALTTHGSPGVLFRLPEATLPRLLGGFTVGGTVESEIVAQAAAEALVVVGVMGAFGAFNAVVSHDELVRSLPRAFHEPGLVLTVGLAFVPSTLTALREVRDADRCRTGGHPVRRGRLRRTTVPVLESGLERAVSLSESLDSRGFARLTPGPGAQVAGWLALIAVVALGAVLVALVGGATPLALALFVIGTVLLVVAVAVGSRATVRTRHRRRSARGADWLVGLAAIAAVVGLVALSVRGEGSLHWSPAPLRVPSVSLPVLLVLALLAVPALLPLAPEDDEP